ncbi:hypothetical protein A2U01_0042173, partial [Trifolium medium]|nr:hypothetical protein [Trifolium medium]
MPGEEEYVAVESVVREHKALPMDTLFEDSSSLCEHGVLIPFQ